MTGSNTLQRRHNERDGVSNHRRLHCLLNCWFGRRSKNLSKLRFIGHLMTSSWILWESWNLLLHYKRHINQFASPEPNLITKLCLLCQSFNQYVAEGVVEIQILWQLVLLFRILFNLTLKHCPCMRIALSWRVQKSVAPLLLLTTE